MKITPTRIEGVAVVETRRIGDHRGVFSRLFCTEELTPILNDRSVVQINHSLTQSRGAVRGMHFQFPPHAEMKLVRCLRGRIWDVAVDLRRHSATFLEWHAEELAPDSMRMLVIPEGCAHGFQVLENDSELLYLHTASYNQAFEGGVRHDDPRLAINWPIVPSDLSERDLNHPLLTSTYEGIEI